MPETPPTAQQGQPQQPPFGSSPVTGPTPNKGFEAAGMQRLGMIIKQLTEILPMFGAGSEQGKAILDSLQKLSKHMQPGNVSQASERNNIEQMALKNAQNTAMAQQMRQQQGGQQPAGPQGAAGAQPQKAA